MILFFRVDADVGSLVSSVFGFLSSDVTGVSVLRFGGGGGGPPGWLGSTFKVASVLQMQLLSGGLEVVLDLPLWHMQEVA